MNTHTHQEGMERFITHIPRLSWKEEGWFQKRLERKQRGATGFGFMIVG